MYGHPFCCIGARQQYTATAYADFINHISIDGVSIFFVLSGFLIGGILIKVLETEPATFKTLFNFWIRRWFRTLPNYLFILLILIFFYGAFRSTTPSFTL